jgi:type III secretion system PrgH/EprH family protein
MHDLQTHACVLRIFNGPLQGCEFVLEQPSTLFLVGPQSTFCNDANMPSVPAEAIYIPLEQGGRNFEVLLADNSREGCMVRELGEEGQERSVPFQTLAQVGELKIALRGVDEPWADSLLLDLPPGTVTAGQAKPLSVRMIPWWATASALCLMIALLLGGWYSLRTSPVSDVRDLIAGSPSDLQVLAGPARKVYVMAASERDAGWARQVLMRNGHDARQVVVRYEERLRLQRVLAHHYPYLVYHRIDLSDPGVPQLWVSNQRNLMTAQLQTEIEALLVANVPYATQARVRPSDDRALITAAEQGLARLAVPYERLDKADSVTFTLQGSLQDSELVAVRDYVNEYYRLWGDRYVHFAVELKDDWLKGKSFQYGPQGYIKMTPSSWYFPKPL